MDALPIGLAKLTRLAFAGVDLSRVAGRLLGMCEQYPDHAGALMDLAVIDQLEGNLAIGLKRQAMALTKQRVFRSTCCGANPRLRVLAFVAASDIGANTPLEFLLEGSDIALTMVYVMPGRELPSALPDHDLAFVAIAATSPNRRLLAELEDLLAHWPTPVVNLPGRVSMLEPVELAANLTEAGLRTPILRRVPRDELCAVAESCAAELRYPIVIRAVEQRNERGAEKVDTPIGLGLYLGKRSDRFYLVSPFVDCRGQDGLFRKIRLLFIDRRPYACHLAVSEGWNGSYVDARMEADMRRRREEEHFFATFDTDFVTRHSATLEALVECVGLTYFGVDCAETKSGELVVFKVDHTLLVHDMDPVDVFPYKPPQMRKIFDAFASYLHRAAG
ncbi:hypothetical protein FM996_05955 [Methylosinus sporium]|uniref:RimK family alpha-L-glutamate ligase n=2 Tax=Methylocystaceae TaxID=31993 RepID=A0A549T2Q4_METSR|nr:hypothetical protein [Methylosinus sp. KRF6]TRL36151.1 hypothetical protein FM996_05955 [Methylosinus sporium]